MACLSITTTENRKIFMSHPSSRNTAIESLFLKERSHSHGSQTSITILTVHWEYDELPVSSMFTKEHGHFLSPRRSMAFFSESTQKTKNKNKSVAFFLSTKDLGRLVTVDERITKDSERLSLLENGDDQWLNVHERTSTKEHSFSHCPWKEEHGQSHVLRKDVFKFYCSRKNVAELIVHKRKNMNEWMKVYRWRLTNSTQNYVCARCQVPPQTKNTITLGQYNPQIFTPKTPDRNYWYTWRYIHIT